MSRILAFDLNAGWTMEQLDARRHLVDVLPAVPAGTNETLRNVLFADPKGLHAQVQWDNLVVIGGFQIHASSLAESLVGATIARLDTVPRATD